MKKIIWIIVLTIIIIGTFVGLTIFTNITGNVITGRAIGIPLVEQESFKINENINKMGGDDDSQNSG